MRNAIIRLSAFIVTTGFAFASAGDAAAVKPVKKPKRCSADVRVVDAAAPNRSPPNRTFSAIETVDLLFEVVLHRLKAGEHLLRLELFTPQGHLFRPLSIPFSTSAKPKRSKRRLPGFGRPVEVRLAQRSRRGHVVRLRFPIAGTTIVRSGLYGTWTMTASLDGKPVILCGDATFTIAE